MFVLIPAYDKDHFVLSPAYEKDHFRTKYSL